MTSKQNTSIPTGAPAAADAVDFEPMDRSSFLLKGVLATGALYGAAAVSPMLTRVFAQGGGGSQGDIDILNFALTLELLEADFYRQGLDQLDLSQELSALAEEIGSNEEEHVDALTATIEDLGGKPVKSPKFNFDLTDEAGFVTLAVTFEDTGVSAYNGAGPAIQSKDLLAVAGQIVQVEARHAAAVRILDGEVPVVAAFDPTLDMDEVLEAVSPFIQS